MRAVRSMRFLSTSPNLDLQVFDLLSQDHSLVLAVVAGGNAGGQLPLRGDGAVHRAQRRREQPL